MTDTTNSQQQQLAHYAVNPHGQYAEFDWPERRQLQVIRVSKRGDTCKSLEDAVEEDWIVPEDFRSLGGADDVGGDQNEDEELVLVVGLGLTVWDPTKQKLVVVRHNLVKATRGRVIGVSEPVEDGLYGVDHLRQPGSAFLVVVPLNSSQGPFWGCLRDFDGVLDTVFQIHPRNIYFFSEFRDFETSVNKRTRSWQTNVDAACEDLVINWAAGKGPFSAEPSDNEEDTTYVENDRGDAQTHSANARTARAEHRSHTVQANVVVPAPVTNYQARQDNSATQDNTLRDRKTEAQPNESPNISSNDLARGESPDRLTVLCAKYLNVNDNMSKDDFQEMATLVQAACPATGRIDFRSLFYLRGGIAKSELDIKPAMLQHFLVAASQLLAEDLLDFDDVARKAFERARAFFAIGRA